MSKAMNHQVKKKRKQKYSLLPNFISTQPPEVMILKQLLAGSQKGRQSVHPEHSDDFRTQQPVRWPNTSPG